MKKLLSFLILSLSISLQAQISTQKVVNTAVIYQTNSYLRAMAQARVDGTLTLSSNINLGAIVNIMPNYSSLEIYRYVDDMGVIYLGRFGSTSSQDSSIRFHDQKGLSFFPTSTNGITGSSILTLSNSTLTAMGTNTFNVIRWTNGVISTANAGSKVIQFSDEAITAANYLFKTDNARFVSITNTIPILAAYAGGANESFTIRNIGGPIVLVPDAPDGSIKWAPTAVGIIHEVYYLGNTNISRSSANRTQLYYAEHTDPTIPAFGFLNTGTNVNSLFSIVAFNNITKFHITTVTPGIANFIIGSTSADSITMNAGTMAIPNGFNIGSGQLNIPAAGNVTSGGNPIMACIVTNVMADFPNILAAGNADLNYIVAGTITNMPCVVGHAASEDPALAVNALVCSNGTVTLRARNVGSLAVNQGDLPYRIQIVAIPVQ